MTNRVDSRGRAQRKGGLWGLVSLSEVTLSGSHGSLPGLLYIKVYESQVSHGTCGGRAGT